MSKQYRVFLPCPQTPSPSPSWQPGDTASLNERESHHLRNVLRCERGGRLVATCPVTSVQFEATIQMLEPQVMVSLDRLISRAARPNRCDTLLLPLLKGDRTDLVVEKATEIGAGSILVFQAERSVVRLDKAQSLKRQERWRRIAEAAATQSRRSTVPEIHFFASLAGALGESRHGFYASLRPEALLLRQAPAPSSATVLVVGPEGDFSPEEELLLHSRAFTAVSLGSQVLRAETAAMVLLASVHALWGESTES